MTTHTVRLSAVPYSRLCWGPPHIYQVSPAWDMHPTDFVEGELEVNYMRDEGVFLVDGSNEGPVVVVVRQRCRLPLPLSSKQIARLMNTRLACQLERLFPSLTRYWYGSEVWYWINPDRKAMDVKPLPPGFLGREIARDMLKSSADCMLQREQP